MHAVYKDGLFAGKTVFVAGGTSGINLGLAEAFAAAGARLSLISRSQDKVDAAVKNIESLGVKAIGFAADVRQFDQVKAAFEKTEQQFGKVDVVISGAAGNFLAAAADLSANGFKVVVDIDLLGTFNVLRASLDHLAKPAAIINISAPQSTKAVPMQSHVCAAKAGVDQLTRCLAIEWGPRGIRVNAIQPGPIEDTEGMARLAPNADYRAKTERAVPLGRFGAKSEVADLALFLCSDAARYITGAVIPCDGGLGAAGFTV